MKPDELVTCGCGDVIDLVSTTGEMAFRDAFGAWHCNQCLWSHPMDESPPLGEALDAERSRLAALVKAAQSVLACIHHPNPTAPAAAFVRPGNMWLFQEAIASVRAVISDLAAAAKVRDARIQNQAADAYRTVMIASVERAHKVGWEDGRAEAQAAVDALVREQNAMEQPRDQDDRLAHEMYTSGLEHAAGAIHDLAVLEAAAVAREQADELWTEAQLRHEIEQAWLMGRRDRHALGLRRDLMLAKSYAETVVASVREKRSAR